LDGRADDWGPLDRAFDDALAPILEARQPLTVLFSGGVDSGLLAWELREAPGVSLFTVGVAGADDLERARAAAPAIGTRWAGRELHDAELVPIVGRLDDELRDVAPPRRGIFVALAAAVAVAPPGVLVCGQGADELFLGYAHFRGLPTEAAGARRHSDLATLVDQDWPRTGRIAAMWGRQVLAPYLDPSFVHVALGLPIVDHVPGALTKPGFRRWASHRGLPPLLADRPKRALQYGSGVDRWLRERGRRSP
jgi:asparagine synthase (glutamine-hydrolysing)